MQICTAAVHYSCPCSSNTRVKTIMFCEYFFLITHRSFSDVTKATFLKFFGFASMCARD